MLSVEDPAGDDHGPGSYTYPTDPVFVPGSYDLTNFEIGIEGTMSWSHSMWPHPSRTHGGRRGGCRYRHSISTSTPIPARGPGAGHSFRSQRSSPRGGTVGSKPSPSKDGNRRCTSAQSDGSSEETRPSFEVTVFSEEGRVVARLPRQLLPDGDPASWGYTVALLSQRGSLHSGVRQVRDVSVEPSQYRIGGGAGGVNDTRILDLVVSQQGEQEDGPAC